MAENTPLARMAETRLVCEREIPITQPKIDSLLTNRHNLLDSAKSKAQQTVQLREKLGELRSERREAEDAMVKALAVKNQKEGKRIALTESISVAKARTEELKRIVEDQRKRKEEYAAIISQQSEALGAFVEILNQNREHIEQVEEAISWYNSVLGLRIESGHGVRFIFTNIDQEQPNKEYSFTVRHEKEIYTLLDCEPQLRGTGKLVNELNKSNGLFKFVRIMKEKFQAAACGTSSHGSSTSQVSSMVSLSAPATSDSIDPRHESPLKEKALQYDIINTTPSKVGKDKGIVSPGSTSSVRRSARLKAKK